MSLDRPFPCAHAARLPDGVVVQPRRFEFADLEAMPQYWFAGNPVATHMENAFSILIPPGERFFIRSVRNYSDDVTDPETRDLIRAFSQQEGFHSRAHAELNESFARFGVDVERESAFAGRVFKWMQRVLSKKTQLGVTAFLEHLTATAAHMMFREPLLDESLDPEMRRFWRWHAAEELEHKAVAFDLLGEVAGGYLRRVYCAVVALVILAVPYARIVRRMIRDDPHTPTSEERKQARALDRKLIGPQLKLVIQYFRPGFHPWDAHDEGHLQEWYATDDAA